MATARVDDVFRAPGAYAGGFKFDEAVANVFDDMLLRSVPFYPEQQRMIVELARMFWQRGTLVYDLGCSTATTAVALAQALGPEARIVGYDNSPPMIEKALDAVRAQGLEGRIAIREADLNDDAAALPLDGAGIVTLCWTLQFVRPENRAPLVERIYDSLEPYGALLVTEKIVPGPPVLNRAFVELYEDFKRRNRYSEVEIARKREALENVLVPYRPAENIELFERAGFETVETFFQWYNFAGFVCVKSGR